MQRQRPPKLNIKIAPKEISTKLDYTIGCIKYMQKGYIDTLYESLNKEIEYKHVV